MDLSGFGNAWEHLRLLSDAPRNEALVALLRARAPGSRVLEVGCGTGLLSCVAARLGASHVYAVEPTPLVETARALVAENGLGEVVTVLHGRIQDLAPRPVDLAFSELLNAFPFQEGVLPAMDAAAAWGPVQPHRLRVWAALVRDPSSADERRHAMRALAALETAHGLRLGPVRERLERPGVYRHIGRGQPCGPPALLYDLAVGTGARPEPRRARLTVDEAGPVGGAMVWFSADYGVATLQNPPNEGGHWGQLVCAWPELVGVPSGGSVEVAVSLHGGLSVQPA